MEYEEFFLFNLQMTFNRIQLDFHMYIEYYMPEITSIARARWIDFLLCFPWL